MIKGGSLFGVITDRRLMAWPRTVAGSACAVERIKNTCHINDCLVKGLRKYDNNGPRLASTYQHKLELLLERRQLRLPATKAPQQTTEKASQQITEIKDYSLKYINALLDKQYTDCKKFYNYYCLTNMGDQGVEFIVAFVLMLLFSKQYKDKSVAKVMNAELGTFHTSHPKHK